MPTDSLQGGTVAKVQGILFVLGKEAVPKVEPKPVQQHSMGKAVGNNSFDDPTQYPRKYDIYGTDSPTVVKNWAIRGQEKV